MNGPAFPGDEPGCRLRYRKEADLCRQDDHPVCAWYTTALLESIARDDPRRYTLFDGSAAREESILPRYLEVCCPPQCSLDMYMCKGEGLELDAVFRVSWKLNLWERVPLTSSGLSLDRKQGR